MKKNTKKIILACALMMGLFVSSHTVSAFGPGSSISAILHPGAAIQHILDINKNSSTNLSFVNGLSLFSGIPGISKMISDTSFFSNFLNIGGVPLDHWTLKGNKKQRVNVVGNVLTSSLNLNAGNASGTSNVCVDAYGRLKVCKEEVSSYTWKIGEWSACSDAAAASCTGSYQVNAGGSCGGGTYIVNTGGFCDTDTLDKCSGYYKKNGKVLAFWDLKTRINAPYENVVAKLYNDDKHIVQDNFWVVGTTSVIETVYQPAVTAGEIHKHYCDNSAVSPDGKSGSYKCFVIRNFNHPYGRYHVINNGSWQNFNIIKSAGDGIVYDRDFDKPIMMDGIITRDCSDFKTSSECKKDPYGLGGVCKWDKVYSGASCGGLGQSACNKPGCTWKVGQQARSCSDLGTNKQACEDHNCTWNSDMNTQSCTNAATESACKSQNENCSFVPAGTSVKTRTVTCVDQTGKIVADSLCAGAKPVVESSEGCVVAQPQDTFSWDIGNWGSCTKVSGGSCSGTYTESVQGGSCHESNDTVYIEQCLGTVKGSRPAHQGPGPDEGSDHGGGPYEGQSCAPFKRYKCGGDWETHGCHWGWAEKSNNWIKYAVETKKNCSNVNTESDCNTSWKYCLEGPDNYIVLNHDNSYQDTNGNTKYCAYEDVRVAYCSWTAQSSNQTKQCSNLSSAICESKQGCHLSDVQGEQTRAITCRRDSDHASVADSYCSGSKPSTKQGCEVTQNGGNNGGANSVYTDWVVGSWSACSGGKKTRSVSCPSGKTCNPDLKPINTSFEGCVSGGCFIQGTKVTLADGSDKDIEEVQIGDVLKGQSSNNIVLDFHRPLLGDQKLYAFNGGSYFVTDDHPFMTDEGWKALNPEKSKHVHRLHFDLGELREGDILLGKEGKIVLNKIDSKSTDAQTSLYNFVLSGDKTYYADGFLVHNKLDQSICEGADEAECKSCQKQKVNGNYCVWVGGSQECVQQNGISCNP